jgi:hypothetical protein
MPDVGTLVASPREQTQRPAQNHLKSRGRAQRVDRKWWVARGSPSRAERPHLLATPVSHPTNAHGSHEDSVRLGEPDATNGDPITFNCPWLNRIDALAGWRL